MELYKLAYSSLYLRKAVFGFRPKQTGLNRHSHKRNALAGMTAIFSIKQNTHQVSQRNGLEIIQGLVVQHA